MELTKSKRCCYCCFADIVWVDRYLLISFYKVNCWKYLASSNVVGKIVDMTNRGYRSGIVLLFRVRKSPHGLQPVLPLHARCKGEDHGLSEGRHSPICSICSNSPIAIFNFSVARRRRQKDSGGTGVVLVWWTVSWLNFRGNPDGGRVKSGNSKIMSEHSPSAAIVLTLHWMVCRKDPATLMLVIASIKSLLRHSGSRL